MKDGLVVNVLLGDNTVDDLGLQLLSDLLRGDITAVLGRDNDSVDSEGDDGTTIVLVLHGDLGLGIGSEPGEGSVTAGGGHGLVQLVGE